MSRQEPEANNLQKLTLFVAIIATVPFSIIYLLFWRGRCVHCRKRILFNKRVCKKCTINSHTIVEDFDDKIEMFYQQIAIVEDISDIINQYNYVFTQFDGITLIYDTLDEEVDIESIRQKATITLERTLDDWINRNIDSFKSNPVYKEEVIEEIENLIIDISSFEEILTPYLDEIKEL